MTTESTTIPSQAPRVRFAPSPTGYLHVGGARTALFNWLFARHNGGAFVLRIEDTDFERSSEEMVQGILDGMRWLGLDWDEGPFFQSERLELYRRTAEELLAGGHAYHCFCTREILEEKRRRATASGRPPMYDRACRAIDPALAARRRQAGELCALRFAVPQGGVTAFDDQVFGRVEFANQEIEDFVLLRSDGVPTYHLSVVADDLDMRMTHIIRGADHLSNTPKQVLAYQALGRELPIFAHVPLILGPDKSRLSKRHGATSVTAYQQMGIVPEAFRNFLALLGWTPPDAERRGEGAEGEVFDSAALIQAFSLDGISRSNAVFDVDKLAWFNTTWIRRTPAAELLPLIEAEWASAGFTPKRSEGEILQAVTLLQSRARSLKDFAEGFRAFFDDAYETDAAAAAKFWKEGTPELLSELAARYEEMAEFTSASTEQALRALADRAGVKAGLIINAARVALTGQGVAPGLFDVMTVLGKTRVVQRLRNARAGIRKIGVRDQGSGISR